MDLREYQRKAYDLIEGHMAFDKGREICLEAGTGWGKSLIIAELAKNYKNVVILTNITKLIYQTSDLLDELGIGHTIIKANLKKELNRDSGDGGD